MLITAPSSLSVPALSPQFVNDEENDGESAGEALRVSGYESPIDFRSPMGFTFYMSMVTGHEAKDAGADTALDGACP